MFRSFPPLIFLSVPALKGQWFCERLETSEDLMWDEGLQCAVPYAELLQTLTKSYGESGFAAIEETYWNNTGKPRAHSVEWPDSQKPRASARQNTRANLVPKWSAPWSTWPFINI